jgi:hypothetical protein
MRVFSVFFVGRRRLERRTVYLKDSGAGDQYVQALKSVDFFEDFVPQVSIVCVLSKHTQCLRPTFVLLASLPPTDGAWVLEQPSIAEFDGVLATPQ